MTEAAKIPLQFILKQCEYRKVTTFVLASIASGDLELLKWLK